MKIHDISDAKGLNAFISKDGTVPRSLFHILAFHDISRRYIFTKK